MPVVEPVAVCWVQDARPLSGKQLACDVAKSAPVLYVVPAFAGAAATSAQAASPAGSQLRGFMPPIVRLPVEPRDTAGSTGFAGSARRLYELPLRAVSALSVLEPSPSPVRSKRRAVEPTCVSCASGPGFMRAPVLIRSSRRSPLVSETSSPMAIISTNTYARPVRKLG